MEQNRREFLKGAAWMDATAMAAGCMSVGKKICDSTGAPMHGFAVPPMKRVRVGVIDMGKFDFSKGVRADPTAQVTA